MRTAQWRALLFVGRRQWAARKGITWTVLIACVLPLAVATLSSFAADSSRPRPGELARRELGGYSLRVQANAQHEAHTLLDLGRAGGVGSGATILSTPMMLLTKDSAVSVTLERGQPAVSQLRSRYQVLEGRLPDGPEEVALTRDAATALGVAAGHQVQWRNTSVQVTGILLERNNFYARTAVSVADPFASSIVLGDPARTHYNVYFEVANGDEAATAALADTFLRRGYGVLTPVSWAEELQHSDGELVVLLGRLAVVLLALSLVVIVPAFGVVARLVEGDLRTLYLLGFDRKLRTLLAAASGGVIGLTTAAVGILLGSVVGIWSRPFFERLAGSEWYATRADQGFLLVVLCSILAVSVVAAGLWARSSMIAEYESVDRPRGAHWLGVARWSVVVGTVFGTAAIAVNKSTYLLAVAVVVSPGLAVASYRALAGLWARRGARQVKQSAGSLLLTSYLGRRMVIPSATAAITAGLLAFPIAGVLMISGIEEGSRSPSSQAIVPRPEMAVYVGPQPIASGDEAAISEESGVTHGSTWALMLLQAGATGEQATAWVPALPAKAAAACVRGSGRPAPEDIDLCNEGLRGVAMAPVAVLQEVLGRELSPSEQSFYTSGGAIVFDPTVIDAGKLAMMATSGMGRPLPADALRVPALAVTPGPGTQVSAATPVVWLFSKDTTTQASTVNDVAVRRGQQQTAFSFATPVTPEAEQHLRRAIVRRVEVGDAEEFLITRLDATKVSLVRRALDNLSLVLAVLTTAVGAYAGLALRREVRRDQQILDDLGISTGQVVRWRGTLVAISVGVGAAVALVVGAVCAAALVYAETGGHIPTGGWVKVLPVLVVPGVAAAVGALMSLRRSSSAWSAGFSTD